MLVGISIFFLVKNLSKENVEGKINQENQGVAEKEKLNTETNNKIKTIEEMLSEFGGEILEQVNSDTYYIKKDEVIYTAYVNDEIVEGRIVPWSGVASQPAVDADGNINIYTAEELKWVADQVINGEKNFNGVTITLRQDIDLGARKKEDGSWEGNQWTPIIGFLDELPPKEDKNSEENKETENPETPVIDESVDTINENLKRFAGIFDGNNHSIRGLYINTDKRYQGLFGISTGTIQNLTMKNSFLNGGMGTGAIVGLNGGKILNSNVKNTEIKGTAKVGGIAGICMSESWLENCITSSTSIISGGDYTGGIIGYANNNSTIINCENEAVISGNNFVGGNVGIIFYGSTIKDSINRSNCIIGEKYVGGISGYSRSTN